VFNDVLPVHGNDQWVAVTARNEREWAALRSALGLVPAPPPGDPDTAYAELAAASRPWDANRLEARLTAAGVPAARSMSMRSALAEARLAGRGVWQTVHTAVLGDQVIVGLPWTFDGTPYDLSRPGPNLGEHSALILKEWLGE
jgi:crotonobetainyl-CoA:carnitine CoA-transferase CaiB-like acyl-CoA transferase